MWFPTAVLQPYPQWSALSTSHSLLPFHGHYIGFALCLIKFTVALGRLTSLGTKSRHTEGLTNWDKRLHLPLKHGQATCSTAGLWPKVPCEIIAGREMQLSFENLAVWWHLVLKPKEMLSGGLIIGVSNELDLTKPNESFTWALLWHYSLQVVRVSGFYPAGWEATKIL